MTAITSQRFWSAYRGFQRIFLWMWFVGVALCLAVAALRLGRFWLWIVFLVTIYPAIIGWLGFNGIGILLKTRPPVQSGEREPINWLLWSVWLLLGMIFVAGAVGLLVAVVWRIVV
ncbi:MAG TPA: hypothetical protein VHS31_16190 [Tepidisphaeraceae bacterium]|jgi:hypothetical protein|nr:hypothetical protein [Tepidisphaeraceae bacterium]